MSDHSSEETGVPRPARGRARRWLSRVAIPACLLVIVLSLVGMAVDHLREASERIRCNIKQVGLAFHSYNDAHGRLPPAAVTDKYGRPLLSWRVLLLPYIEQDDLYKEFHLDEPWDSPHNLQLLPRMPVTYAPPGRKAKMVPPHHTTLHVFVGKRTPFEEGRELRLDRDFPDGTSSTLLFVEAGEPVPWTKPEELSYDPDGPLPDLHCLFRDGFRAGAGDSRFLRKDIPEQTLRALITRNGDDDPGAEW
jgi:hypothetical protein